MTTTLRRAPLEAERHPSAAPSAMGRRDDATSHPEFVREATTRLLERYGDLLGRLAQA